MRRHLRAITVVHPFPSVLNGLVVASLYLLAGGSPAEAALLGAGMVSLQFAIGAVNDLADEGDDTRAARSKPIPSGLVSRRTAALVAVACTAIGLGVYAAWGLLELAFAIGMLACGLAYDLRLKRAGLGWLCFAIALPLLPASTWVAATGALPPRSVLLLPVAALAGPTLHLANGLVDLERDAVAGIPAPAVTLGRRRSLLVLGALVAVIYGIAWLTLLGMAASPASVVAVAGATGCALAGVVMSASPAVGVRERGWRVQAVGLALLTVGWLTSAT